MAKQEYLARIDGHKVIGTNHSWLRLLQRDVDGIKTKSFYRDMVDKCLKTERFMSAPDNTEWFIFSRRLRVGMMITFRRDYKDPSDTERHFIIMTVYPKGMSRPMQPDTPSITV